MASARTLRAPGRRGPGRRERSDRSRRPERSGAGAPTRRPVPKRQRRPGVRAAVEVRPVACRAQRAPAGHFRADTRAGTRRLGELSGRLTWWRGFSGAPLPWGPLHPTCRFGGVAIHRTEGALRLEEEADGVTGRRSPRQRTGATCAARDLWTLRTTRINKQRPETAGLSILSRVKT